MQRAAERETLEQARTGEGTNGDARTESWERGGGPVAHGICIPAPRADRASDATPSFGAEARHFPSGRMRTQAHSCRSLAGLLLLVLTLVSARPSRAGDAQLARQLTDRGIELQQSGDHDSALRLFDAALMETDHPKIRYFRAKSLRGLGRRDEAIAEFEGIVDRPEVAKYRTEILAFVNDMKGEKEREELAKRLDAERQARERAEAERKALELKADATAIELLRRKRSGLMPTSEARAVDGPVIARVVPMVPTVWEPTIEYEGHLKVIEQVESFERYELELTVAKVLTVVATVGVSMGVGLGLNPLADHQPGPAAQQAGLAIGVVGVVAGMAAAVVWPATPPDTRPGAAQ